ncbi:hypothetical protein DVK85_05460 [Flavobacterium arcticum]|uniref:Uncharacterized protein n=1 Tax=Flavobacterium arcticum TaxID=1784713 RepID=A0A345HAU7_9FLAO|nr:DUF5687 family protein [Flavobacterium arcticum]AXG73707.1 hypothetical protein DVK85_05460 [Flavobacterium arcticum]KAF2511658.1 hypothetical protein E0W72_04970 [Flavobacterium arcticum]
MFRKFIALEWKAFFRSPSFTANVIVKVFMILGGLFFMLALLGMGFGSYFIIEDSLKQDPLEVINKYIIYYLVSDIMIRYFLQKIPVINIKPFLTLPIKRSTIVSFALGKTALSFFNYIHAFFFIPFSIVMLIEGHDPLSVGLWHLGIFALIYCNNFMNILINNKDGLFVVFMGSLAIMGGLQYYEIFDATIYTSVFFQGMYATTYIFILPIIALIGLVIYSFRYFKQHLYQDTGLAKKQSDVTTQDYSWLNRYGTLGTFLKNDIKLIIRNKRSKTTVGLSLLFLFYGLAFFTGIVKGYDNSFMHMFAAIFVTGGFLFTFGQFVPSWDSAYYPLMMSQNIQYREYISSKWWLVVIGTFISTILALPYIYFGLNIYLMLLAAGVYNIGVNSHLILLGGAYIKTPIDLASSKQAFGDKKAFNVKTLLITLPKMIIPMALYSLGDAFIGENWGVLLVIIAGIIGFTFRNKVFSMVEKIYKTEKYKTLASYKQKN